MFFPVALFLKKCASLWCRRRVFPWPGNSAPVFPDRTAGLSSDRLPASSAQLQHQRQLAGDIDFWNLKHIHKQWAHLTCCRCNWLLPLKPPPPPAHYRLNMELDPQNLIGLLCTAVLIGSYTRALLVNQDRRHLFVTPCPPTTHTS
jgi:hypothetical protein